MARRHGISVALLALSSAVLASLFLYFGFLNSWQEKIFDRFFVKSSPAGSVLIVAVDDESIKAIGSWPWRREFFGQAVSRLQSARIIGIDVGLSEPSSYGAGDDAAFEKAQELSGPKIVLPLQFDDRGVKITRPSPSVLGEGTLSGFVNVVVDYDGLVRKVRTAQQGQQSFSKLLSASPESVPETIRIAYAGPAKTYPTVRFSDLVAGKIPDSIIKDKIVLVGVTAADLHDIVETPVGRMAGVEVHANIIATLERADYFRDFSKIYVVVLLGLVSTLSALCIYFLRRYLILALTLFGLFVFIQIISIGAFGFKTRIPNLYLTLAWFLTSGSVLAYQYIRESREKQFIKRTFSYYLMPEIVNDLIANPEKLRLGGEKRTVTILFSDIRGFTGISEALGPERLTHMLNLYLTAMSDHIMKRRGLVDKYIGDAIMAFWGAPLENTNQTTDAAEAVLAMVAALNSLNMAWRKDGVPEFRIGIGVNTGEVIVGNMGSKSRFNYSILGDEVNFASRLEGLNKEYGTTAIFSESSMRAVAEDSRFKFRELDMVIVKGKKIPKKIYELIVEPLDAKKLEAHAHFARARELYKLGKFREALVSFKKAEVMGDAAAKTFVERTEELIDNPPKEWAGVYEFQHK